MSGLVDGDARHRFACELDKNFSVIASAGSGKTRAITDRVVKIAKSPHAVDWLPQLVVVTYTNRAADEMQQRTRQQILEAHLSLDVVEAFNRAFFGTIHSFCMKLLAAHGHHLGLPANLELITDDNDVWNQFVQQYTTVGRSLSEGNRRVLLRQMAESAHAMNGDQIPGTRAAMPQRIEGRDPGAQQRRRFDRIHVLGQACQRRGARQHVGGIAAVARDAGRSLHVLAGERVPVPTAAAVAAGAAVPTRAAAGSPAAPVRRTSLAPARRDSDRRRPPRATAGRACARGCSRSTARASNRTRECRCPRPATSPTG